jgi:hypothetical protein
MKFILAIAILALAGCAMPPVAEPEFAGIYKNACLPEAIAMAQGLKEKSIQARVLRIQTNDWGHAVTVYLYPTGANKLYAWDSYWQSINLRAWFDNPTSIANAWLNYTHPNLTLANATFLD